MGRWEELSWKSSPKLFSRISAEAALSTWHKQQPGSAHLPHWLQQGLVDAVVPLGWLFGGAERDASQGENRASDGACIGLWQHAWLHDDRINLLALTKPRHFLLTSKQQSHLVLLDPEW